MVHLIVLRMVQIKTLQTVHLLRYRQNNKASKKRLCFWATRYDCFEDKEEYLFGIDCLGKCLSDLEGHYNLQKDRRIAANFKRDLIAGKKNLPFPYVVSISLCCFYYIKK